MKSILEFNLPEEKEEFEAATKALLYKEKIDSLYDKVFRPYLKYDKEINGTKLTKEESNIIYRIWQEVREHFEE